jgi:hypothetical protein
MDMATRHEAKFNGCCPLCGGAGLEPSHVLPDVEGKPTQLWKCVSCFAFVPETAQLGYEQAALDHQVKKHSALWKSDTVADYEQLRADLNGMVGLMSREFGPKEPENLLVEIGAGRGGLLRALLDQGYSAIGCEPADQLVKAARERYDLDDEKLVHAEANEYLDVLIGRGLRPRVFILWHVLEHMLTPLEFLRRCLNICGPEGSVIMQLPLLESRYVFAEHHFFATPESAAFLARELGGLPHRHVVDTTNDYITFYLGACALEFEHAARSRLTEEWLTEMTGDNLNDALMQASADEPAHDLDSSSQLDWLKRVEESNRRIIAKLTERLNLEDQTRESADRRVRELEAALQERNAEVETARSIIAERDEAIKRHIQIDAAHTAETQAREQTIVALTSQLDARDADLERLVLDLQLLRANGAAIESAMASKDHALEHSNRLLAEKEEALQAQTRMIDERWDAMQDMGREISSRDARIVQLGAECERLSSELHHAHESADKQDAEFRARLDEGARERKLNEDTFSTVQREYGDLLRQRDSTLSELRATLAFNSSEIVRKNEIIVAQTRMVDERWSAMQEMGKEIFARDQTVARQALEIERLSSNVDAVYRRYHDVRLQLSDARASFDEVASKPTLFGKRGQKNRHAAQLRGAARSGEFSGREHNRYWWHKTDRTQYVPLIYDFLDGDEWNLMYEWFEDSGSQYESTGEANIPPLSLLFGLISGNGINRIVQCGHYVGYSTLLLGFLLRRMGCSRALYSIDIDKEVTAYTNKWVKRADLARQVKLAVSDSSAPAQLASATAYLQGSPQLVFIDSSHEYGHTLKELDQWYGALEKGGFIVLHDTSIFAASLDRLGNGGVGRAVQEWCASHDCEVLTINGFVDGGFPGQFPYLDGCGLSIIQKSK